MQEYFQSFRENIIGDDVTYSTPFHHAQRIIYADWTASGRCYAPIETMMKEEIFPFVANTHTETNTTGMTMTVAYHRALQIIKQHVNANADDVILSTGSGMTGVVNKLQRILGFKVHEKHKKRLQVDIQERPIVFVTHMEHHSNQTSWLETIADVEIINPTPEGLVDLVHFKQLLSKYKDRYIKIAAVTSCSNVTGVFTPYHQIAEIIHQEDGLCFVDFACSAPYIHINMHPENPLQALDAIYFSPHKFLGGPGTTGILVFNKRLYNNEVPDVSGGGTVEWTNPWKKHRYIADIEQREDGGTPAFLQTIKAAMCVKLKEAMGVDNMLKREKEQNARVFERFDKIPNLHLFANNIKHRLSVFSFYIEDLHYNLGVKLLNDRFGVQVRGGCSCAGTYGHYLFNIVEEEISKKMTDQIDAGDYTNKLGWIRMSLHPTMSDEEIDVVLDAIEALAKNHKIWGQDYERDRHNQFKHKTLENENETWERIDEWFDVSNWAQTLKLA